MKRYGYRPGLDEFLVGTRVKPHWGHGAFINQTSTGNSYTAGQIVQVHYPGGVIPKITYGQSDNPDWDNQRYYRVEWDHSNDFFWYEAESLVRE